MGFWEPGPILDLLLLAVLLALAAFVRGRLRWFGRGAARSGSRVRLEIPDALLAGALGFVLGPSGVGWLPFDVEGLELIVYHLFAVVFIAQSLCAPRRERTGDVSTIAMAVPTLAVIQLLIGLGVVALFMGGSDPVHPGFGFMMMLGFLQGPGQALALGTAFEAQGLPQGSEIGLAFAAIGFLVCGLVGVPLVPFARKLGWDDTTSRVEALEAEQAADEALPRARPGGVVELLALQILVIACVYAATWLVMLAIGFVLPEGNPVASMIWGFHFIVGALIGLLVRRASRRVRVAIDDDLQNRISAIAVDFTTAGALAAVQMAVLSRWLSPILVASIAGTVMSLWFCLWVARRGFGRDRFGNALVLFGAATGTLSTGLALLRIVDPRQRGHAARNAVMGMAAAVVPTTPLMLGFLPLAATSLWPLGPSRAVQLSAAFLFLYLGVLIFGWRKMTPLRAIAPHWHPWPREGDPSGAETGPPSARS